MKIKVKNKSYKEVMALPKEKHLKPVKPNIVFRTLLKAVSEPELKRVSFSCERVDMEKLRGDEPALFLMNHSCFTDLKIAASVLYPRPFNIVCTEDGFVGKRHLMRLMGCIPTKKFINDTALVKDIIYAAKEKKCSILMYPEASYSFDGTATPLPPSVGKLIKLLKLPVVMIKTYGAFSHDPLYNMLKQRKVKIKAEMKYLLPPEKISELSVSELNEVLKREFTFDAFAWQKEEGVIIDEPFRADGLNRVLYKCPVCQEEGSMQGEGTKLSCHSCGKVWSMQEDGSLLSEGGVFGHIPDWYSWERECVKKQLEDGSYRLDVDVDIYMMVNTKCIYRVGEGHLSHTKEGFCLTGCDGELNYTQGPTSSYSLYSDYYWYEIGDMISIGNNRAIFYCFPKGEGDVVAKTRLATEELYKTMNKH